MKQSNIVGQVVISSSVKDQLDQLISNKNLSRFE